MYKKIRKIKVIEQSGYKYKPTPTITLKGQWLQQVGFNIGDMVCVECSDGRLVLTNKNEAK